MSDRQQITIKAKCKGVMRLLKIPKDVSYEAFYELLKNSFGISSCQLQYSDEEGDSVELGSQDELQEALKVGESISQLKITLITQEYPTMNAMINKPSDLVPSTTTQEDQLSVDNMNLEDDTVSTTSNPSALVQPLSSLTINEKPTPKPRPNRKRIGFYTSLCSDIVNFETGESSTTISEDGHGGAKPKNDPKVKKEPKKPKKEKPLRGSKYYASLADDIAAMNFTQPDQQERKEMKRKNHSRKTKTTVDEGMKEVERDLSEVSLGDEEPPKWFNKVVTKMSESVSSQVLGALNGAVISTTTAHPAKLKRDGANYVHDGIACNGCKLTIIGPRYKCGNCPNFDLCEECEAIEGMHDPSHVFLKLRYPGIGIGRRHSVMIPLLKDIIYKSKDVALAEQQDKRMKEVRKKLKQLAKKKREEQIGKKKADKKMKKLQKAGSSNSCENLVYSGYELVFLGDESYPDGTEVTPGFEFTKCWKIRNTGTNAWDKDTKLTYLYGGMRCLLSTEVEVPQLEPGQEGMVMVTFIAPLDIGEYCSVWRAAHNGKTFGSKVWCKIKVVRGEVPSDNDDEIFLDANDTSVAPMQESTHESFNKPDVESQESSPTMAEPDPIFHAYTTTYQSQEDHENTAAVNSSESQATTTDVSLLECNEWDTCLMDDDPPILVIEDDVQDVEVISNASSDDFCVVPLPACFDPDIPLNIEDFGQGSSVEPPVSLAQEMDPEVPLGSPVNQQDQIGYEEQQSDETSPATEPAQDGILDPQDEPGSSEEDITIIPIIPERPPSPEDSRERDVPAQRTSAPINIEVKNTERIDRQPLPMPSFDARSAISEPVAPQPPSLERTPLIPGRLPASPPGRAVPVVQVQISEPRRADSVPGSYEVEVTSSRIEQGEWQAVRTQPPDNVSLARQISEVEETVTIQPGGASTSQNQSTAQFASTFVAGTLKRAFGTVTDTVTSFMSGKDNPSVVYTPNGSGDNVHVVHVVLPEITPVVEPQDSPNDPVDTRVQMKQLREMGFCDRQLNERLLRKHNMDVSKVVTELVHENDNDWSAARH